MRITQAVMVGLLYESAVYEFVPRSQFESDVVIDTDRRESHRLVKRDARFVRQRDACLRF